MLNDSETTPKSTISVSSTEETTIPNIVIEELPDTYILDKKEQIVVDYEVLSKSSDGDISDNEEPQKHYRKRSVDDDPAEVTSPSSVNSEERLIIEEIHDVESIGKEKIVCAAIIEEVESYQDDNKKGNNDSSSKFKKNKKRKTINE